MTFLRISTLMLLLLDGACVLASALLSGTTRELFCRSLVTVRSGALSAASFLWKQEAGSVGAVYNLQCALMPCIFLFNPSSFPADASTALVAPGQLWVTLEAHSFALQACRKRHSGHNLTTAPPCSFLCLFSCKGVFEYLPGKKMGCRCFARTIRSTGGLFVLTLLLVASFAAISLAAFLLLATASAWTSSSLAFSACSETDDDEAAADASALFNVITDTVPWVQCGSFNYEVSVKSLLGACVCEQQDTSRSFF